MNIQLFSDLHLECQPQLRLSPAPGADLLVLAGDIGSYQTGSQLDDRGAPRWGLERFSPRLGHWPVPVLYVPGNHEYDGLDFDEAHARLQAVCRELGIIWLEQATQVLGGVRFVGCTLWSDFEALVRPTDPPERQAQARAKAWRAANWYLEKTGGTRAGAPLLADGVRALAQQAQQWLVQALSTPFDGPTVAITHFAPSLHSADPRYGRSPGTAGFCNALDALLPHARLWLHGHLHCGHDYTHQGCRVVANPLGYAQKGEQAGFLPHALWTVPTRAMPGAAPLG